MTGLDWEDTIVGPATPVGNSARSILRMSGPQAHAIARQSLISATELPWQQVFASDVRIVIEDWERSLDARLLSWPDGRSYTGQASVELHLPIGSAVVTGALQSQWVRHGARLAKPGEFTLRSFLSGRLDLAQAEGVLGLIEAENLEQLQQAIDQRAGGLSRPIAEMRGRLLDLLADVEAGLDFVEEDIQFISDDRLCEQLEDLAQLMEHLLAQLRSRESENRLPKVVLTGPPNAGKSSLLNALAGQTHALVSPVAGTTRDYVSAPITHNEITFELIDTAGIEDNDDSITTLSQQSREAVVKNADLQVICIPADAENVGLLEPQPHQLVLRTKADVAPETTANAVSIHDQASLERVKAAIADWLVKDERQQGIHAARRCRDSLQLAASAVADALHAAQAQMGQEYVAVSIREALAALGEIVGVVYTDDLLDRIFSRFCIGK